MNWLLIPGLKESKWLTNDVKQALEKRRQGVPQLESQDVIDEQLLKWAVRNQGQKALENPDLLPTLRKAFASTQPLRFEHLFKPLAINNTYLHIPPATMVPHNGAIIPYIVPYPDGGRLILIDPLNHVYLTPMCCAALIMGCYDLNEEQIKMLTHFVIVTAAYYSPERHKAEDLLNSKQWNDLSDKLLQVDAQLSTIAERMSFNIIAFAIYHEVSHSILGHLGHESFVERNIDGKTEKMPAFSWEKQQELDADAQASIYFRDLISMSNDIQNFWTGNLFDHAPLVFFRLLELTWKVAEKDSGKKILSSSHPRPIERFRILQEKMGLLSDQGKEVYERMMRGIDRFEIILANIPQNMFSVPKTTGGF